MAEQNQGKAIFYEVNPRYFYDANNDGIGDLKGLINKFEYLSFLGVNALILQNALAADSKNEPQSFLSVAKEIGTTEELAKVIAQGKKFGISIFLELNIGSINLTSRWFEAASVVKASPYHELVDFRANQVAPSDATLASFQNEKTGEFYVANRETREVALNWNAPIVSQQFLKVIKAWHDQGVTGFVLKNYANLAQANPTATSRPMDATTVGALRAFYQQIKALNKRIIIIGKGPEVNYERANTYTADESQLFDFFYNTHIALLGTKNNSPDQIGRFDIVDLANALAKAAANKRNIIAFGSSAVGRVASRWGNDGQLHLASAKSLAALLLVSPAASLIYYGDELGTKNINLRPVDDFQDQSLEVRKKARVSAHYSETAFMAAQVLQNPIHARSIMAWDTSANGGFSTNAATITPLPSSAQSLNVASEYNDAHSVLQFYRQLINLVTISNYAPMIATSNYEVKFLRRDLLRLKLVSAEQTLVLYTNFSSQTAKSWWRPRTNYVLHSSYGTKKYDVSALARVFEPYETYLGASFELEKKPSVTPRETLQALETKVLSEAPQEVTKPVAAKTSAKRHTSEIKPTKVIKPQPLSLQVREATKITPSAWNEATSETNAEKRKQKREAAALQKVDGYDGATRLSDAQVAKTTQVSVNDADDIEAFLRALDKKRK